MTAVIVSTSDTLAARAVQHLTNLGDTPQAVYERLLADACYGEQEFCGRCPIAVYLLQSVELGLHSVSVEGARIALHYGPGPDDVVYVDIPDPVREFILAFDQGRFPKLAAGGAR